MMQKQPTITIRRSDNNSPADGGLGQDLILNTTNTNLYNSGRYSGGNGDIAVSLGRRLLSRDRTERKRGVKVRDLDTLLDSGSPPIAKATRICADEEPRQQGKFVPIPRAPSENEDDEDDVDEDELYLRLLALRSLAPDLDDEKLQEAVATDTLVDEMEELLEEADEAADAIPSDEGRIEDIPVPLPPTIDIPGSDEEKMDRYMDSVVTNSNEKNTEGAAETRDSNLSFLVQKMRKSLARQKEKEAATKPTQQTDPNASPCYTPTQSPVYHSRGSYSPEIQILGPSQPNSAASPVLLDLTDSPPCSPPFIPVLPPADLFNIDLPPDSNEATAKKSSVQPVSEHEEPKGKNSMALFLARLPGAEPLPPGDEESFHCSPPKPPSINNDPVDMELGSENEAEIQFFKDQQDPEKQKDSLFPLSVWEFGSASNEQQENRNSEIQIANNAMIFSSEREQFEAESTSIPNVQAFAKTNRRKRRGREKKKALTQPSPKKNNNISMIAKRLRRDSTKVTTNQEASDDDDDEEVMRAKLLSSMMAARMRNRKDQQLQKQLQVSPRPESEVLNGKATLPVEMPTSSTSTLMEPTKGAAVPVHKSAKPPRSLNAAAAINRTAQVQTTIDSAAKSNFIPPVKIQKQMVSKSQAIRKKTILTMKKKSFQPSIKAVPKSQNKTDALKKSSDSKKTAAKLKHPNVKKKHFPNLFTKTVIVLAPDSSDDEELGTGSRGKVPTNSRKQKKTVTAVKADKTEPSKVGKTKSVPGFGASLEQLLKEGRKQSEATISSNDSSVGVAKMKKTTPPPKPARKNLPAKSAPSKAIEPKSSMPKNLQQTPVPVQQKKVLSQRQKKLLLLTKNSKAPKLATVGNGNSSLVPKAARVRLLSSSVKHLPKADQEEYKRLKALIAKKELQKKKEAFNDRCEEDPEVLRKRLLESMGKKENEVKVSAAVTDKNNSQVVVVRKASVQVSEMTKVPLGSGLKVSIDSRGRNVQVNSEENANVMKSTTVTPVEVAAGQEHVPDEHKALLNAKEMNVIVRRKEVTADLFKLSAQLSMLIDENKKLAIAQEFRKDLLSQLAETERLLNVKEERIQQLRTSVKSSHQGITLKRSELSNIEQECKELGKQWVGIDYRVPQDGSDKIKTKLASIASNTKQLKESAPQAVKMPKPATEVITDQPSDDHLTDNYSTALAHLKTSSLQSLDPHKELCRFQLQGTCNDDQCPFQHLS